MNTPQLNKNVDANSLAKLYAIFVRHPRLTHLMEAIEECLEVTRVDQESRCMTITGDSGVGKSTLIAQVLRGYPTEETPTGRVVPILAIDVPKPTSVKGVVTTLLSALGDPMPERGNTVSQTERLYKLVKQCKVEMIILDEFQHVIDEKTDRVLLEVSDFVKTLINRTRIAFVLVGMPKLATLLEGDGQMQLRSRFMHRMTLEPFHWLKDNGDEYRMFLKQVQATLPFPNPTHLSDYHFAMRLHVATGGYLRYTMRVIKSAARKALKLGLTHIDDSAFASAYDLEIGTNGFVKFNPFLVDLDDIENAVLGGKKKRSKGAASNRIKSPPKSDPLPQLLA